MTKKRRDILAQDDKDIGNSQGLGYIWRKLLVALSIKPDSWLIHLNHYINDPSNRVPNDPKSKATERGNIEKALFDIDITWAQFQKGIKILRYSLKSVTLVLRVETQRGSVFEIPTELLTTRAAQGAEEERETGRRVRRKLPPREGQ